MTETTEKGSQGAGRHRVVIVGGGIAGQLLATRLSGIFQRSGRAEGVLIDRSPTHVWTPMLHSFAAGTVHPYQQKIA
ncbi:hypothetical protein [Xanthobacter sp. ZOL 2024]